MKLRLLAAAAAAALSLAAFPALADVAPPDSCNGVGDPCNVAPPDFHSPGVCQAGTCQKENPDDGGIFTYECDRCVATGGTGTTTGATTSTGGATSGGATSGGGSGTKSATTGGASEDSGGCAVSAGGRDGVLAFVMIALGAGALAASRRRRR